MIDITERLGDRLVDSGLKEGMMNVFVMGSTAALIVSEYERGLLRDFSTMLERIAPRNIVYEHEKAYHDGNGHSHVRASLIGPSLTVPFTESELCLGTWQRIVFVELDIRPRKRSVVAQFLGT